MATSNCPLIVEDWKYSRKEYTRKVAVCPPDPCFQNFPDSIRGYSQGFGVRYRSTENSSFYKHPTTTQEETTGFSPDFFLKELKPSHLADYGSLLTVQPVLIYPGCFFPLPESVRRNIKNGFD